MSGCIICLRSDRTDSVEHIIPRALGNIHYVLPKGVVCQRCNNRFSKSEHAVLNSFEWFAERRRLGLVSAASDVLPHELLEHHIVKFLVKIFFEALYASRYQQWIDTNLEPIRLFLDGQGAINTKLLIDKTSSRVKPLPKWMDRWRLRRNKIILGYTLENDAIYFSFSFSHLRNLLIIN